MDLFQGKREIVNSAELLIKLQEDVTRRRTSSRGHITGGNLVALCRIREISIKPDQRSSVVTERQPSLLSTKHLLKSGAQRTERPT